MADSFVQLPTDSTGKKIDTRTEGTNSEHRQVFVLGDPATNAGVAPVDATAGLKVDLGADNDVTVTSGTVTANMGTVTADPFGANADAASATGSISAKLRFIASTGIPITGTVTVGSHAVTNAGTFAVQAASSTATGSAVPANAYYQGVNASTALPTAATAGNLTGATGDKYGRAVVIPGTIRDLVGTQATTITASTSETTIVTAAASVFNDLTTLIISNTSATAARVDIRDTTGGSVLFSLYVPAGDMRGFCPPRPLPQTTVNTNWTAQSSASVTDLRIYCVFDKNK